MLEYISPFFLKVSAYTRIQLHLGTTTCTTTTTTRTTTYKLLDCDARSKKTKQTYKSINQLFSIILKAKQTNK